MAKNTLSSKETARDKIAIELEKELKNIIPERKTWFYGDYYEQKQELIDCLITKAVKDNDIAATSINSFNEVQKQEFKSLFSSIIQDKRVKAVINDIIEGGDNKKSIDKIEQVASSLKTTLNKWITKEKQKNQAKDAISSAKQQGIKFIEVNEKDIKEYLDKRKKFTNLDAQENKKEAKNFYSASNSFNIFIAEKYKFKNGAVAIINDINIEKFDNLAGANFDSSIIIGGSLKDLSANSLGKISFKNTLFKEVQITNTELSNDISFEGAIFDSVDFRVTSFPKEQVNQKKLFHKCKFHGTTEFYLDNNEREYLGIPPSTNIEYFSPEKKKIILNAQQRGAEYTGAGVGLLVGAGTALTLGTGGLATAAAIVAGAVTGKYTGKQVLEMQVDEDGIYQGPGKDFFMDQGVLVDNLYSEFIKEGTEPKRAVATLAIGAASAYLLPISITAAAIGAFCINVASSAPNAMKEFNKNKENYYREKYYENKPAEAITTLDNITKENLKKTARNLEKIIATAVIGIAVFSIAGIAGASLFVGAGLTIAAAGVTFLSYDFVKDKATSIHGYLKNRSSNKSNLHSLNRTQSPTHQLTQERAVEQSVEPTTHQMQQGRDNSWRAIESEETVQHDMRRGGR